MSTHVEEPDDNEMEAVEDFKSAFEEVFRRFHENTIDDEYVKNIGAIEEFTSINGTKPSVRAFVNGVKNYNDAQKRAIVQNIAKVNKVSREQEYLYIGNYLHYGFLKSHMRKLLSDHEGMFACVDKFGSLSTLYKEKIVNADFEIPTEQKYYYPVISSIPLWFDMITALIRLHAGDNTLYFQKLVELEKFYKDSGNVSETVTT